MDDVDNVRPQPLQRRLDAPHDTFVRPVRHTCDAVTYLRRQHEFIAPMRQVAADALLGDAVRARRIDQGESRVEHVVQRARSLRFVEARITDLHRAETQRGNLQPAVAERTSQHQVSRSGSKKTAPSGGRSMRRRHG